MSFPCRLIRCINLPLCGSQRIDKTKSVHDHHPRLLYNHIDIAHRSISGQMLDIYTVLLLATSGNLFLQPLTIPSQSSAAMSGLFNVVSYSTTELCHDVASVTLAGCCYVGDQLVRCDVLGLGQETLYVAAELSGQSMD